MKNAKPNCRDFLCIVVGLLFLVLPVIADAAPPVRLNYGLDQNIKTLEPGFEKTACEHIVNRNLYDPLIFPDPDPKVINRPWIAESWKVSRDAKTYTFTLRKGIKFHDGSEITAEDVVFSMERAITVASQTATYFKDVKRGSTKALDKFTVQFNLEKPHPAFMQALYTLWIVNKDLVINNLQDGPYGEFKDYGKAFLDTHDAGSGPYKVKEMKRNESVTIEWYADYALEPWKPEGTRIEEIKLSMVNEWATLTSMFKKGEMDIVPWGMPASTQRLLKEDERFAFFEAAVAVPWFITLNNKKPPLDDVNVRKAIAYVFDYETVMQKVLDGGDRSRGPVPNSFAAWNPKAKMYVRDVEKAKAYIEKSKYTPAQLKSYTLELAAVAGSERFKTIALLLASNMSEIGLNSKIVATRYTDILDAQTKVETAFHATVTFQSAFVPHPYYYLIYYTPEGWHAPIAAGGIYYQNPKVTELFEKAKIATSLQEQNKYYMEMQELIVEDAPSLFMHQDWRSWPRWRYIKKIPWPVGAMYFETRFNAWEMDTTDKYYKQNHKN